MLFHLLELSIVQIIELATFGIIEIIDEV